MISDNLKIMHYPLTNEEPIYTDNPKYQWMILRKQFGSRNQQNKRATSAVSEGKN
jgi:hypothetical protein